MSIANSDVALTDVLLGLMESYEPWDEQEREMLNDTMHFVTEFDSPMDKSHASGHVTASGWVVDFEYRHVLLTHHFGLNKWLQLGGHCEKGEDVVSAAKREVTEESGLKAVELVGNGMFSIDVHRIPASKGLPSHTHYDVCFLFMADRSEKLIISAESKDLRWIELKDIAHYNSDRVMQRMVSKTFDLSGNQV